MKPLEIGPLMQRLKNRTALLRTRRNKQMLAVILVIAFYNLGSLARRLFGVDGYMQQKEQQLQQPFCRA
jgi:hypothetical protein